MNVQKVNNDTKSGDAGEMLQTRLIQQNKGKCESNRKLSRKTEISLEKRSARLNKKTFMWNRHFSSMSKKYARIARITTAKH